MASKQPTTRKNTNTMSNSTKRTQTNRQPKRSALVDIENAPQVSQRPATTAGVKEKGSKQKQSGNSRSKATNDVLERNQPVTDNAAPPSNEESTAPADIQGRPKRQKVSRIDRLNKESEIIGQDLMRSMAKSQGHKRKPSATVNDGLFDIPEDTPINSMAPPTKKQRMALPSTGNSNLGNAGLAPTNPFSNIPSKTTVAPPPPSQIPQVPRSGIPRQLSYASSLQVPVTGDTQPRHPSLHKDGVVHNPVAEGRKSASDQNQLQKTHKRVVRRQIIESDTEEDIYDSEDAMQFDKQADLDMENLDDDNGANDWCNWYDNNDENGEDDKDYEVRRMDSEDYGDYGNRMDDEDYEDDENREDENNENRDEVDEDIQNHGNEDYNVGESNRDDHHNGVNEYEDRGENPDNNAADDNNNAEPEETSRAPAPCDRIDVLDDHRARNRGQRPPREEHIAAVARQQGALGRLTHDIEEDPFEEHNDRVDEDEDNEDTQADGNDDGPEPRKRAPRHSCNPGMQVRPTTLAYYNGPWKTVLADSKVHWRRELAIGNAWPTRQDDLHIVRAILEAQILRHKNKGAILSDEFQVNRDMHTLIFQEASTFRGKLKDYIRPILPRFYIEVTPEDYKGNQLAVFNAVIERVKDMLDSGSFHHGPTKDSLGKTNNFAHPCIGHVIQQFFYNKPDGVARSFQDDFSEEVPLNVIALVATAIVGCLEEYLATGKQRNLTFDAKGYMGTYNNMVKSVERVHNDPYHGKKLTKLRRAWAAGGMAMLNPVEETFGRDIPVDLN